MTKPWERLLTEVGIWAEMVVLYRVVANPWPQESHRADLKAFLAERRFVPNLALSQAKSAQETVLQSQNMPPFSGIPGLMTVVYGEESGSAASIAIKEHVAAKALAHPAWGRVLQKNKPTGLLLTTARR